MIAAAAGGALETVLDGRTGRLARLDDVESFAQAIATIDELDFDPGLAIENAARFSVAAFQQRLSALVARAAESAAGRSTGSGPPRASSEGAHARGHAKCDRAG